MGNSKAYNLYLESLIVLTLCGLNPCSSGPPKIVFDTKVDGPVESVNHRRFACTNEESIYQADSCPCRSVVSFAKAVSWPSGRTAVKRKPKGVSRQTII